MLGSRFLFVHAHPDDETITTGSTIAKYVALGAQVCVLTCTRGELGEVFLPELKHLEVGGVNSFDDGTTLGVYRSGELREALQVLQVDDQRFLGDYNAVSAGFLSKVYRDSGMVWGQDFAVSALQSLHPQAFCAAELGEVSAHIAQVIRVLKPHVVVTYNSFGGYGHPDHIRAHEATKAAVLEAAQPAGEDGLGEVWDVPRLYFVESAADSVANVFSVVGDLVSKVAALKKYRTQLLVAGDRFCLTNFVWQNIVDVEFFSLGYSAVPFDVSGMVVRNDLLEGVEF